MNLLISTLCCCVAYLAFKIILIPCIRLLKYKSPKNYLYYFPLLGIFFRHFRDIKLHGDARYIYKVIKKQSNSPQLLATNLGSNVELFLIDTKLIKEFYNKLDNYERNLDVLPFFTELTGKGLITSDGNLHKSHRKIISNVFQYEYLEQMIPCIINTTKGVFEQLKAHISQEMDSQRKKVKILDWIQLITGETIGQIFFGDELNQYQFKGKPMMLGLASLIHELSMTAYSPLVAVFGEKILKKIQFGDHKKLLKNTKEFRRLCLNIIQQRQDKIKKNQQKKNETNTQRKDLIQLFLENSYNFSIDEQIDEFITFFIAGMDTTAHFLTLTLLYLANYPRAKEQLLKEIEIHFIKNQRTSISKNKNEGENLNYYPTRKDFDQMEYTYCIFKEVLRINSPAAFSFPMRAKNSHYLGDQKISQGTTVSISWVANTFDPQAFANPEKFMPERWQQEECKQIDSFIYLPFSYGSRRCIGQHFAMLESKIIISEFLKTFDFFVDSDYELKIGLKFLMEPVDDIYLNLSIKQEERNE